MYRLFLFIFIGIPIQNAWGLVEVYEKENFDGLAYKGAASTCLKLQDDLGYLPLTPSLKTDQCLTVFNSDGCTTDSRMPPHQIQGVYLKPGDYANLSSVFTGTDLPPATRIASLMVETSTDCTNADQAFAAEFYNVLSSPVAADKVLTYSEVCGCTDLPTQSVGRIRSMRDPGHCVRLFDERNCEGTSTKIPAGRWMNTTQTKTIPITTTKSISTCDPLPNCMRIMAVITKVEIYGNEYAIENVTINDIDELGSLATFENNGPTIVSAEYNYQHQFNDRIVMAVPDNLLRLNPTNALDVEFTSNDELPAFAKTKIVDVIKVAFEAPHKFSSSTLSEFLAKETVQVPSGQKYKVNSYVTGVQNYPVQYTVYARLIGQLSASADPSSHILPQSQLQIVAKELGFDPITDGDYVVVRLSSHLVANLGMEAVVIDQSSDIVVHGPSSAVSLAATSLFTVLLLSTFSYFFK